MSESWDQAPPISGQGGSWQDAPPLTGSWQSAPAVAESWKSAPVTDQSFARALAGEQPPAPAGMTPLEIEGMQSVGGAPAIPIDQRVSWSETFGAIPGSVAGNLKQTAGGMILHDAERARQDYDDPGTIGGAVAAVLRSIGIDARSATDQQIAAANELIKAGTAQEQASIPQGKRPNQLQSAVLSAANSIAQQAPGMAASIATRSAGPMLAGMYPATRGSTYADARSAGLDPERARLAASIDALVEVGTEMLPAIKMFKPGSALFNRVADVLQAEMPGELAATILQSANAKLNHRPDMTVNEFIGSIAQTALSVPISAGIQTSVAHGALKVLPKGEAIPEGGGATPDIRASGDSVMAAPTIDEAHQTALREVESAASSAQPFDSGWSSPDESKWDDFVYKVQDRQIDTKRVIEEISKTGEIADESNPRLMEELYHKRKAKRVDDFRKKELAPLIREIALRGVTLEQFEEFLHARHAKEANAHIAKINPEMADGGSGMTNAEADRYMSALPSDLRVRLDALAAKVDAITEGTRKIVEYYGLESPDTINQWRSMFAHYVPLFREDKGDSSGIGQGFSVRGPVSKHRTGSGKRVVDILGNVAMQRERAITRGEKDIVAKALYRLAKANPNNDFWKLAKPRITEKISPETGDKVNVLDFDYQGRDNVVMSREVGKDGQVHQVGVEFNPRNPRAMRMAAAMKNLDVDDLGAVLGASAKITRYIASVNTQYNPVFGIFNFTRDIQGAMLNLSSTPLAGKQKEVAKRSGKYLIGIYRDLRDIRAGRKPKSKVALMFEEMQLEGGTTGYSELFKNSKDRADALLKEIKRIREGKVKKAGRAIFDWLSDYNETMENAVRLAVYEVARDSGISKPRAASLAKNITVNFNRKGQIGSQAGAMYAFFNASMQGTARIAETLSGPAGKKIVAGGLLLGVMQSIALMISGFGPDDPSEFVRERNIIIPIGWKKYFTIPMPLGFHIIPNIGRVITDIALYRGQDAGRRTIDLAAAIVDAFNPVGSGTVAQTISPTTAFVIPADIVVALAENKDWTGRKIYIENSSNLDRKPGHQRVKDTATMPSKFLSWVVNAATGGTDYKPGLLSPTPDQFDYVIGQLTGGVGREASKTMQTVTSLFTGEELPTHKYPLVGRLYGDSSKQANQSAAFYRNIETLNEHENELKGRAKDGKPTGEYFRDNPDAALINMANLAERTVSNLRKQKRDLLKRDAPREQIKRIEDQITTVMRKLNEAVDAKREKPLLQ